MAEEQSDKPKTISVVVTEDSGDRGFFDKFRLSRREIPVEDLKQRLHQFLDTMKDVVQSMPEKFGEFGLDSVTLTVEITAKGQVSLLGTGGEVGGKGGLTFTLKRAPKTELNVPG